MLKKALLEVFLLIRQTNITYFWIYNQVINDTYRKIVKLKAIGIIIRTINLNWRKYYKEEEMYDLKDI